MAKTPAHPLVLLLVLVCGAPASVAAQSAADSIAIMLAVGDTLRALHVRAVSHRFICHDGMHPCRGPDGGAARPPDPLVAELARAAGARLVPEIGDALPPCPWGLDPLPEDAGYVVGVVAPRIRKDTARVLVMYTCYNPPGYEHGIFERDEVILLQREGAAWRVIALGVTRITEIARPPSGARALARKERGSHEQWGKAWAMGVLRPGRRLVRHDALERSHARSAGRPGAAPGIFAS
jgi:hypothetical protein